MDRKTLRDSLSGGGHPLPNQVVFKFKNKVSVGNKNKILKRIRSWKGVVSAEQVFKDTDMNLSESMMGLYILFVRKGEQTKPRLKNLKAIPEFEYAYIPHTRSPR